MKKLGNILLVVLLVGLIAYIGVGHVQKRIEAEKLATANSVRTQMSVSTVTATPEPIMTFVPAETPAPILEPQTLQEAIDETIVEDDGGIYHIVFKSRDGVEVLDYPVSDDETFFFVMKSSKIVGKYYHEEDEETKVHKGKLATMKQVAKCFCKNGEVQKKYLVLGLFDGEVTELEAINFEVKVGRVRERDGSYTYGLILCGGHSKKPSGDGGSNDNPTPTSPPTHGPTQAPPTHGPTQAPPTHGPTSAPIHEPTSAPIHEPTLPPKHEATPAPQVIPEPVHEEIIPPKHEETSASQVVSEPVHEEIIPPKHEETSASQVIQEPVRAEAPPSTHEETFASNEPNHEQNSHSVEEELPPK